MTSEEISNKPILTLDDKNKEQSSSIEKQPTLSGSNHKTEDEQKHKQDFDAIYKKPNAKFPTIINMDKSVLLAVRIRREILKHLENDKDITNLVLNKWIKWYFRKSKYYSMHKVGAVRYNLDGINAGTVTEIRQSVINNCSKSRKVNLSKGVVTIKPNLQSGMSKLSKINPKTQAQAMIQLAQKSRLQQGLRVYDAI